MNKYCDGITRRNFLTIGGSLFGGLALSDILKANENSPKKSVIFIFFSGGIAHQETFIVKPDTIESQRPINGHIQTSVPGMLIGNDFPNIARKANNLKLVHSFGHDNAGHAGGSHWTFTGFDNKEVDNGGVQTKPAYGAIVAKHLGTTTSSGLPNYVRNKPHMGDGSAFLGKQFGPFDVSGDARNNLRLNVNRTNLEDRRTLLRNLDSLNRDIDNSGLIDSMDSFGRQAFDLMLGNANEIFDINRESVQTRNKYGNNLFGQQLLLARRLVENGVSYVSLAQGGWDYHSNISQSFKTSSHEPDQAISALIDDIYQRGMQDDVLIVMTSEFGRTSLNAGDGRNGSVGRDHDSRLIPLVFSGGGITTGGIIGEANNRNDSPRSNRLIPADLSATILNHLGIPLDMTVVDQSGRPQYMVDNGRPIRLN